MSLVTANLIIDISNSGDVVARTSYRAGGFDSNDKMVTEKMTVDSRLPNQVKSLLMINNVLNQLISAKFNGEVCLLVNSLISPKMFQAKKLAKSKTLASDLTAPFMYDYPVWVDALEEFATVFQKANKLMTVNFFNSKELYFLEITGNTDGLENGQQISFVNSVNEELGIGLANWQYINGKHTVKVEEQYNGKKKYFVQRNVRTREDGSGFSQFDQAILEARKVHAENVRHVPSTQVVKTKVSIAANNNLF